MQWEIAGTWAAAIGVMAGALLITGGICALLVLCIKRAVVQHEEMMTGKKPVKKERKRKKGDESDERHLGAQHQAD